jgi:ribosomal protein L15E
MVDTVAIKNLNGDVEIRTMTTEEQITHNLYKEKMIEFKTKNEQEKINKQSALNKLKALGLNDAEINSILGK